MESGRHERDKASPLLMRFPELRALPYNEREEALSLARRSVWRRWPVLLAAGAISVLMALWGYALVTRMETAESIWWAPFLAAMLLRQSLARQLRRELRQVIARR